MCKTIKKCFDKNLTFEKMMSAYERAKKGKGNKKEIIKFEMDLESNICNIIDELKSNRYKIGKYRTFTIYEPKQRIIKALPFKDRVVQQWYIEEFIKPYFTPRLINTTCACIEGKGTLYAVNLCQKYMRSMRKKYGEYYVLKCDIKKYFYTIDRNILFKIISKHIVDKKLLELTHIFIFESDPKEGIPIGNLSSQWFANIYMNELGIYIKEKLKIKHLIIYMDDLVILCKNKIEAKNIKNNLNEYVEKNLNIKFNSKTNYYPSKYGINFCGYIIYGDYKLIRKRCKRKINSNIKKWSKLNEINRLNQNKMTMSYKSWISHVKHADTFRYRYKILDKMIRNNLLYK